MWWVLSVHAGRLDDVEAMLAANSGYRNSSRPKFEILVARQWCARGPMWWVLSTHAGRLDDVEATLAAYRGCGDSPLAELCAEELPLLDRLAVGIALGHLAQYEPPGSDPARVAVRFLRHHITLT